MRRAATRVREEIRRVCRSEPDPVALHRAVAELLPAAVPFDRWCGLVLDPATLLTTSGYHEEGLPSHLLPRLMEIEAGEEDVNALPSLARTRTGVSTIDRATGDRPEVSARWRDVLEPAGLGREMRAVLRERSSGWGGLVLLRESSAPDFSEEEVAFVADLTEDLARGIRRGLLHWELEHRDDEAVPGMLVVDRSFALQVCTAAARRWLSLMGMPDGTDQLPLVVAGVVAKARTSPDGTARGRLRTASGQWLTLYAEAVTGLPEASVTVVVEPTRPYELAAIMADAYQLTPRERDVTRHVLLGRTSQEIARELTLSVWTVQDHLKNVFEKVGVGTRAELTARMFFGHYEPRARAGMPVGADGWFIEPRGRAATASPTS